MGIKDIQILPVQFRSVALATLAVQVAQILEVSTLAHAFLAKTVQGTYVMQAPDTDDTIVVGMARGDSTVAEIKAALELNRLEPDEPSEAASKHVLWETVMILDGRIGAAGANKQPMPRVSLGGGKGIPFDADDGFSFFAYNIGTDDQVAGAVVHFQGYLTGIWLT